MRGTVFVGVGCSRLLLVAPMKPHLECAHAVTKDSAGPARVYGLSLCGAEGPRGGASERRQSRAQSIWIICSATVLGQSESIGQCRVTVPRACPAVPWGAGPHGPLDFKLACDASFSESNFNDRTTQTALDPLAGSRFVPGNSFYTGSNEGRGPVPSVQP